MESNNTLTYDLEFLQSCLNQLQKKNEEISSLKLKLGEIQNILNSEVKIARNGKIEINE